MTTKRKLTALATLVAAVGLLAGCVPSPTTSPSSTTTAMPTPSPTSTTIGAPTSESQAIENAEATLIAYNEAYDQIGIDGWTDTTPLRVYATEDQYSSTIPGFEAAKTEGRTQTGIATLEILDSQVVASTSGVEYGNVLIRTCFDPSTRDELLSDGSAAPLPTPVRSIKEATVTYSADESKWLVSSFVTPTSGREEC